MKKIQMGAICLLSCTLAAVAGLPTGTANPNNVDPTVKSMQDLMNQEAKKIAEAAKHDVHQDAEGQKHLDDAWGHLLKDLGYDPKDPSAPKDPFVYEGSKADVVQDAKLCSELQKWLTDHHLPPVSCFE